MGKRAGHSVWCVYVSALTCVHGDVLIFLSLGDVRGKHIQFYTASPGGGSRGNPTRRQLPNRPDSGS